MFEQSNLPSAVVTRRSIGACAGCEKSNQQALVGWIKYEISAGSVMTIPGLPQKMTNFGVWTDVCVGCMESGKVTVASIDHPDNFPAYFRNWDAYRADGYGVEVGKIIAEMHAEWTAKFGS